ncbi:ribosome maturation factor RimM [Gemmatimonadetes bacterium T265]|nr:ribosome maturation factor RimM [Gemmatimonadetes bacterium T265]
MSAAAPRDDLALVGIVRRAHGIRGELAVETFTDAPDAVFASGRRVFGGTPDGRVLTADRRPGGPPLALTVRRASPFKEGLIVSFDEIADRTAAEPWRDRALLVPYAELAPPAEDEVYLHELVGMRVVHRDGTPVGEVVDLMELPQGLALDVRLVGTPAGEKPRTAYLPYRPEMVLEVDVPARTITVDPPEGLFE